MNEVYIVSASRTPIGSFGGTLSGLTAVQLGTEAVKHALDKGGVDPTIVEEVLMGNVLSANLGQAPARQVAISSGIPNTVPSTTINKVCSSGLKSVMFGAQTIALGQADVIVAGGMESMSNSPYYLPKARFGHKYGNGEIVDGLQKDGLWEVYNNFAMGNCADHTARKMSISREAQDEYTINSYKLASEASNSGKFKQEIAPISIPQRKGDPLIVSQDEEFQKVNFDKIPALKPVFSENGTVTAANASTLNDGAAAVVLMSKKKVEELGLAPIARILSYSDAAQDPLWFTTAPSLAIPKALDRAGLKKSDVDYYEINEAFAAVALANMQLLDLNPDSVNVFGGAVALGHPLGCSGTRILTTLTSVLGNKQANIGVAGICNGGGGASAMVIERLN
ncbi:acetyl-CoA C-acyltransferase [Marinoscillum sp. MHG1-6]|uniref:acetyl-CoA C-acyltransferase n=1 Tax=Marinoscillum sp. MHG1-6 TaxID=2959627 RepID=UPI00215743C2|nr:acetyl-CoA C-acyltransferase [Marinoscillum sp. MHG1-6]